MVLYFTSDVVSPPYLIYMGNDKFENEELLKWAWPEDVWFHVDKESSAHVYLRLKTGETLDDIPSTVLDDCAQLVKANSIKGNKMSNLNIVYTLWTNLKKTADMEVGQVGYHDHKQVRSIVVEKRINDIVNRLNKTKVIKNNVDLRQQREERDRKERNKEKDIQREIRLKEKEEAKRREEAAKLRSYDYVMKTENMSTNETGYDSDDFM
ncbi:Coiled-coil domain-containing protein 25 [Dermatophagoides pteronyssinus]|uniref:Coiled-coil domain-containing protein 25 n=2 Tax=Dermatophagoides pteronyssinus TaxID=6956 RepID=A0A6P6XM53_DERPT|nr:coiled-coil domain-containing protein 25-like [Dermatophagoides pteronyssinus]KAH9421402.1 Coiled-coil domain-containing protein 25 [Dermatophagoides pteronyssinus]